MFQGQAEITTMWVTLQIYLCSFCNQEETFPPNHQELLGLFSWVLTFYFPWKPLERVFHFLYQTGSSLRTRIQVRFTFMVSHLLSVTFFECMNGWKNSATSSIMDMSVSWPEVLLCHLLKEQSRWVKCCWFILLLGQENPFSFFRCLCPCSCLGTDF